MRGVFREDSKEEDCQVVVARPESSPGGGVAPQDIEDMPTYYQDDGDTITRPGLNIQHGLFSIYRCLAALFLFLSVL